MDGDNPRRFQANVRDGPVRVPRVSKSMPLEDFVVDAVHTCYLVIRQCNHSIVHFTKCKKRN